MSHSGTWSCERSVLSTAAVWLRRSLVNEAQQVRTARLGFNVTWLQHVDSHLLRTRDGQQRRGSLYRCCCVL